MKTRTILKTLSRFALLCAASVMCCCVKDQGENVPVEKTDEFTFLIRVPGNATPSSSAGSRAITEGGTYDNHVDAVDILLFDASTDRFVRSVYCMNVAETGDVKVKSVRARLPQGSYKAVILANSHKQLVDHPIAVNTLRATALAQFSETMNFGVVWNSLPGSSDYRDFPMWGEIAGTLTVPSGGTISVDLYRMLAKVNLAMAYTETTPGTPDFVLKDIRVYNYNQSGYLAPTDANWTANPKQPTYYASREYPANQTTPTALLYDNTTGTNASRTPKYITTDAAGKFYKCVDEIFVFESPADNTAWSWEKNTCLVLGGEYKGVMGYYRIDFAQSNANIDILRNHSYNFSVDAVRNQGYSTPEEALKNKPENLIFDIVVWDEHTCDIIFDNQYMLAIRPTSEFEFFKPADSQTAEIKTTHPDGWQVLTITGADGVTPPIDNWLTIDKTIGTLYGDDGSFIPMSLIVSENTSGGDRTGYIYIKAGNLETRLTVCQHATLPLSIYTMVDGIPATEMIFTTTDLGPKTLSAHWIPQDADLFVTTSSVGTLPVIAATGMPTTETISAANGTKSYSIFATQFVQAETNPAEGGNPFFERVSKVDFTTTNGVDFVSKSVFIRHYNYALVAEDVGVYWLNGDTYSFTVKSNCKWRIKSITEEAYPITLLLDMKSSDNMIVGTEGGSNGTITKTAISFTTRSRPSSNKILDVINVVFESADNPSLFTDVTVKLILTTEFYPPKHSGWAGSNIYYDEAAEHLTFADTGAPEEIQKYQGVYFKWGSLTGISSMDATYSTSTTLYPPAGGTTSGIGWSEITYPSTSVTTIAPTAPLTAYSARSRNYLYEVTNEATGIGDICKHLTNKGWAPAGKKWRMPTSEEFETQASYSPTGSHSTQTSTDATGKYIINSYKTKEGAIFPASGRRSGYPGDNGALMVVGNTGDYWSGSASVSLGYRLEFALMLPSIVPGGTIDRTYGYSVRCVAE